MIATLNGKEYSFNETDIFKVQVSKGKGSYKTRYSGPLAYCLAMYGCINIGYDYNKRIVESPMPSCLNCKQYGVCPLPKTTTVSCLKYKAKRLRRVL